MLGPTKRALDQPGAFISEATEQLTTASAPVYRAQPTNAIIQTRQDVAGISPYSQAFTTRSLY
jgi:hypothetical protein